MTAKPPRESPVSFRPGQLRGAIRQRALRSGTEGYVAKRDLGRYYLLLRSVSLDDRLTRSEGRWLAQGILASDIDDALTGDPFVPEHQDPSEELLRTVEWFLRTGGTFRKEIHDQIGHSVLAKVTSMTPVERAALLDAVNRLPSSSEEQCGGPEDWSFVGVRLLVDAPRRSSVSPSEGSPKGGGAGT